MKIHKLKFENINSLKGKWEIDFDNPELTRENLFLISGKTGSGKSSILDAITLALYEKTPRQGPISGTTNEIMNKHSHKCSSEVEFSVGSTRYVSTFKQHRARKSPTGNLQGKTHSLINLETKENLLSKTNKLEEAVEELIGLNFEQFSKTVMLAQGSFDKFLKSTAGEKATILEQITGTQIYSAISKKVYEHYKNEERTLDNLNLQLNGIELKTDDEIKAIQEETKINEEKNNLVKQEIKSLDKVLDYYEKLHALEQKEKNLESQKAYLDENIKTYEAKTQQLNNYNKALPIIEIYKTTEKIKLDFNSTLKDKETTDTELKLIKAEKAEKDDLLQVESTQYAKENDQLTLLSKTIKDVRALDSKIGIVESKITLQKNSLSNITSNLKTLDEKVTNERNELKLNNITLTNNQDYFKKNNKLATYEGNQDQTLSNLKEYKQSLEKTETLAKSIEKILKEINEEEILYDKKVNSLNSLNISLSQISKEITEIGYSEIELNNQITIRKNTIEDLETLKKDYAQYTKVKQQLEEENLTLQEITVTKNTKQIQLDNTSTIISQAKEIEGLKSYVHLLKEDKACPLCGSTLHPSPLEGTNKKIDNLIETEQQLKKIIKELETNENELKTNITATKERLVFLTENISKITDKINIKVTEDTYEKIIQTKLVELNFEIKKLNTNKDKLIILNNNLSDKKINLATLTSEKDSAFKTLEKLNIELTQYQEQKKDLKLKKIEIEASLDNYILSFEYEDLLKCFTTYNSTVKEFEDTKQNIKKLKNQIEIDNKQIEKTNKEKNTCITFITDLEQELKALKENRFKIFEDKNCDDEVEKQTKIVKIIYDKMNSLKMNIDPIKEAIAKNEQKLNSLGENLKKLDNQINENESKQIASIKNSVFKDIEEVIAYNLDLTTLNTINDFIKTYETKKIEQNVLLQAIKADRIPLQQLNIDIEEDSAKEQLKLLQDKTLELNKQITILQQEITYNELNKDKFKQQQIEISKQKIIHDKWEVLNKAIGSADGKKFKAIAQAITLDYLILSTNQKLISLSPRYELYRIENEKDSYSLELGVIDNYSAGISRPVSNLSGGESFIISFSLALGLSDLLNKKALIETLFLDEGFGTLDEDTLTQALEAIDTLTKEGRVIGIISHVALLHDRIRSQIIVEENGDSTSALSGPGVKKL